jgi:hypothetical protein
MVGFCVKGLFEKQFCFEELTNLFTSKPKLFTNSYRQGWQKPGFFKKAQPGGFFWFYCFILGFIGFYWFFF